MGVAHPHGFRIVYGDLKGANMTFLTRFSLLTSETINILVDGAGIARVADFRLMAMTIRNSSIPRRNT